MMSVHCCIEKIPYKLVETSTKFTMSPWCKVMATSPLQGGLFRTPIPNVNPKISRAQLRLAKVSSHINAKNFFEFLLDSAKSQCIIFCVNSSSNTPALHCYSSHEQKYNAMLQESILTLYCLGSFNCFSTTCLISNMEYQMQEGKLSRT
jgi:hypothetical protein